MKDQLYEYVGAIHVHSDFSDGSKPIPEIARIAESVGLDFLLFADHRTLEPLDRGFERWYGKTLVLIGYEINDPDYKNHYLAFGLKEILPSNLSATEYVREVKKKGGIGFIAHPEGVRAMLPRPLPPPWTQWSATEYDGIEIWNHSCEWAEKFSLRNLFLQHLLPNKALNSPAKLTLERWDRLNQERRVTGIGGADAHGFHYRLGSLSLSILPYKVQLQTIRTHVLLDHPLTPNVEESRDRIYSALVRARCFISNFQWDDAKGFRFWAEADGSISQMGDLVTSYRGVNLHVKVPCSGKIALLRNGSPICSKFSKKLSFSTDSEGAYRVEVRRRGRPWILSNHIRVKAAD